MELKEEVERYLKEVAPKGRATESEIAEGLEEMYGVGASVADVRDAADQLVREDVIHVDEEEEEERMYEYHDEVGY